MNVLCIVPAHNEAESLPALLREIRACGYDAVVINDASTDNTFAVASEAGFPVLDLANNLGIGGGVQTGFMYAVRNGYDVAVQIDGDGQHDPGQIEKVLAPLRAGTADCVIGSRYLPNDPDRSYRTPLTRRLGMLFSTGILWLFSSLLIYDTTSGFRALNRSAFLYFSREYPVDHPEAEALFLLERTGFRVMEVPIRMRSRNSGQSLFTLIRAVIYPFRVCIGFIGLVLNNRR